jgi:toxin YoeB
VEITSQLVFYKDALKDISFWKKSGDKQAINKIDKILKALEQDPLSPTPGETETLKYSSGYSRRINKKDRITYE